VTRQDIYEPPDEPDVINISPAIAWEDIAGHSLLDGWLDEKAMPPDQQVLRLLGPTMRQGGVRIHAPFEPGPVDGIALVYLMPDPDPADRARLAAIQQIVDAHGTGREFTGQIQINGPDHVRTMRRLAVREGRAIRIRPYVLRIDGETGQLESVKPYERALIEGEVRGHTLVARALEGFDPEQVMRWECSACGDMACINGVVVYGTAVSRDCGDSRFPQDSFLYSQ
jgi:hypothetical protein